MIGRNPQGNRKKVRVSHLFKLRERGVMDTFPQGIIGRSNLNDVNLPKRKMSQPLSQINFSVLIPTLSFSSN